MRKTGKKGKKTATLGRKATRRRVVSDLPKETGGRLQEILSDPSNRRLVEEAQGVGTPEVETFGTRKATVECIDTNMARFYLHPKLWFPIIIKQYDAFAA